MSNDASSGDTSKESCTLKKSLWKCEIPAQLGHSHRQGHISNVVSGCHELRNKMLTDDGANTMCPMGLACGRGSEQHCLLLDRANVGNKPLARRQARLRGHVARKQAGIEERQYGLAVHLVTIDGDGTGEIIKLRR